MIAIGLLKSARGKRCRLGFLLTLAKRLPKCDGAEVRRYVLESKSSRVKRRGRRVRRRVSDIVRRVPLSNGLTACPITKRTEQHVASQNLIKKPKGNGSGADWQYSFIRIATVSHGTFKLTRRNFLNMFSMCLTLGRQPTGSRNRKMRRKMSLFWQKKRNRYAATASQNGIAMHSARTQRI